MEACRVITDGIKEGDPFTVLGDLFIRKFQSLTGTFSGGVLLAVYRMFSMLSITLKMKSLPTAHFSPVLTAFYS